MGNRAVIHQENSPVGIYLHWNGGRNSVEGFLKAAQTLECRGDNYGIARLTQIIGNYFAGTCSIGVDILENLDCDNADNGVYVINKEFEIVDRKNFNGKEQISPPTEEMFEDIMQVNRSIFEREN